MWTSQGADFPNMTDHHLCELCYFHKSGLVNDLYILIDECHLQSMKDSWQKTGWVTKKYTSRMISEETIHPIRVVADVGMVEMNHTMSGCAITW